MFKSLISQPDDIMQPVVLAIKITVCVQIFTFGTSLSRGVIQTKEHVYHALLVAQRKTL